METEIFRRCRLDKARGIAYGFQRVDGVWRFERTFLDGAFRAVLTVDAAGQVTGQVIDTMTEEEYLPLRQTNPAGSYVFGVRHAYEELLREIKAACFPTPLDRVLTDALAQKVLAVVAQIPAGKVATYGQIARLIGRPKNARLVGKILSRAEYYGTYPCHRVVNHAGRLAPNFPDQRSRLLAEGVPFKNELHVVMQQCQWEAGDA